MDVNWFYPLASTLVVSLIALVGILFLAFSTEMLTRIIFVLVSFAVGALFGNVFFHLLPESYHLIDSHLTIAVLVLAGLLTLFVLEKFLHWHHDHKVTNNHKSHHAPYGYISLFADGFHNFTDGILIAAGWMASPEIGIATTLAVISHEIPQEISDYAILIHAGFSRKRALWLNFYAACAALAGTLITLSLGSIVHGLSNYILPFAAGGFIYLAGSDLIPELHKDKSRKNALIQLAAIFAGLLLMYIISNGHSHDIHIHGANCQH